MSSRSKTGVQLPSRYDRPWGTEFWGAVNQALRPGVAILDLGSGRRPTIAVADRPANSHYVGLDISSAELEAAPRGSYDEIVAAGAEVPVPSLIDRFDLIVSWQVLEHVRQLGRAAALSYEYARQGGCFVSCVSGRYAVFAIANRILPASVGARLVARLRKRPIETVFPAYYDHCSDRGLRTAFSSWDELRIVPLWHAADYFDRVPALQRAYLRYEDWAFQRDFRNLATHYVIVARKTGK